MRALVFSAAMSLCLAGCAGGGSRSATNPTPTPTPKPATVSVTVTPATATVGVGQQEQFVASVSGSANTAVTWSVDSVTSGNSTVGTIDNSGHYTAPQSAGTHTVTATSQADTTKSASAKITVTQSIQVLISPSSATVQAGQKQQFTATVTGTPNFGVIWSVDGVKGGNASAGTVDVNGLYKAPSMSGTHTVTATSVVDSASSASATVTVPAGISISPAKARVGTGATQQFTITATDPSLMAVTWSVDGTAGGSTTVGTISPSGLYTAPANPGSHTIGASSTADPSVTATASITVAAIAPGTTAVLTYHNDLARTGSNTNETVLTHANVNSAQFGKLFSYPVDGQVYAQPLYVPNLTINGQTHNVVYVATENNSVYAFDADGISTAPLWQVSLGTAASSADTEGISPKLGVTSTPVIDPLTGTLYVSNVAVGGGVKGFHLHALDLITGQEKFGGPVAIHASVPGTGSQSSNGQVSLTTSCYQRAGLALVNGVVYISYGHCQHGWILGYDSQTLAQAAVFNTTPNGAGGAIWMSGGAPAADSNGNLYVMTAVDFNSFGPGYNDTFLKLGMQNGNLAVLDFFTPSNNQFLLQNDADIGSGAPVVLPDNSSANPHELVGGGKDGRIFVLNRDNMGGFNTTDNVVQTIHTGTTQFDVLFDTPAFWNNSLYYHGEQDVVQAFGYNNGMLTTQPTSHGAFKYGNHGATVSISSNGGSDGIAWEIQSDQWRTSGPAILRAYDATNLGNELYDSSQAGTRDTAGSAVKFTVPTVVNGHVYVGTGTELDIYGPLQ